ncbi:VWA domain-containing protein [Halobacteriovorax marinus]|uniref:Membrane protein (von Willebrand factor type A) n=1 Tax=Halobacteriovorax marinus (strain ATCC BAA-682 / DSM 15412 / SJ) TaxID=862908 RepID=E1X296_HALMS|nr:VWA domain-containing protein [Halobacteriovorax marinus]ATH06487.1 VWA domain-containing protein [Halobacteriovorax marinus]CBW25052.1 putative membrane protein (von Willebrand factor type A) [Halobacteriovorax marinus SJ]
MKEIEFATLYNSLWGVLGLIVWTLSFYYIFKKPELLLPASMVKNSNSAKRLLVWLVGAVGWLLIAYSLTQPRSPQGFAKNKIEVNDIFFVIDVSRSMLADDFRPNRLEVAKDKISDFVALRPTDRIGLIMFSERAFTLLPLSTDLKLIKQMVGEINVGGMLGSGTNIGDALGLAVARGAQSLAKNKVIILLTDGVSNVGFLTPIQAAEEAKKQGIKVYTIGIGGRGDAKIPYGKNIFGRQRYQNIPGGSIDFKTLKEIADKTNGQTFEAQDEKALAEVLSEIEKLEKSEIDSSAKIIYKELYLRFLVPGVIAILLAAVSRKYLLKEGGV